MYCKWVFFTTLELGAGRGALFFYYLGTGGWGSFQLGKMATKQEICEISFYIIYSGSKHVVNQNKAQLLLFLAILNPGQSFLSYL
jgi:hypothetical protein